MGNVVTDMVYCADCKKMVAYEIRRRINSCQIRGVSVQYEERMAFCSDCHKVVWVDGIEEFNLRSSRCAYCREVGLITPDEIEELQHKYGIGTRPLSELLGWDEEVIKMYLTGAIPSENDSMVLKRLLRDEDAFYELVEKNKERITADAYERFTRGRIVSPDSRNMSESSDVLSAAVPVLSLFYGGKDYTREYLRLIDVLDESIYIRGRRKARGSVLGNGGAISIDEKVRISGVDDDSICLITGENISPRSTEIKVIAELSAA